MGARPASGIMNYKKTSGLAAAILLSFALFGPSTLEAHTVGENYVWLNVGDSHLEGRFELGLDDLRGHLGLEIPEDPEAASEAIKSTASKVQSYLESRFTIIAEGVEVPYEFGRVELVDAPGPGPFAQYFYRTADLDVPDQLVIRDRILLEEDRFHRSLLCIEFNARSGEEFGDEFTALIFSGSNDEQTLDLTDIQGLLRVREFLWQGILHIWIGIDHVLFLVALLLPSVLTRAPASADGRKPAHWEPVPDFRTALWNIIKIVTTFTIAHSITLTLAALDIVRLPSQFVESTIALSIILVALNNLFPRFRDGTLGIIFFFGLFHGLGFASVMGDLPFRMMNLLKVIVTFNVGVEVGQVVIVAAIFPLLFLLRKLPFYQPVVLRVGSIAICLLACFWFLQRALGFG